MATTCVVGLQWGDEAKGKVVDLLTAKHDMVVRFNGGANAGHTVVVGEKTYKLSLVPSGMIEPGKECVIGNGVAIHPPSLVSEITQLQEKDVEIDGRLQISDRAHVILPYHTAYERLLEVEAGKSAIGTTGRGIGPCYADKALRIHSVRMGDFVSSDRLRERLVDIVPYKNKLLRAHTSDIEPLEVDKIVEDYSEAARFLEPYVTDTFWSLQRSLDAGKSILFEGAQGTLLDIDHGSYPYVTSSNSSVCGLSSGCGVPVRRVDRIIGIVKAYTTRVGGGPFPTELLDEKGEHIRVEGREFGTVTGRPRRCGWFDAVAARYTALLNGCDVLAVMLLDVLSKMDEISICEAYEIDGERTREFAVPLDRLARCRPIFRTLPGWKKDIRECRELSDLPKEARAYLDAISEEVGVPIALCSVGPARRETIHID
ncbi:Adenylosuccinate synthetase [Planctomycetes bacterium Pan216]|uniref:Adenylosuccinate synthetase n=1 Tax=Kolteria novifilia TaxID=2527975 RepID=A0A518B8A9_9BACT|nr:Adenylosuccinate synthetase [Planctomycetes bacterium Pan216]